MDGSDFLSFIPFSIYFVTLLISIFAYTMPNIIFPHAIKLTTIRPFDCAQAIFTSINVITDVFFTILPYKCTFTMLLIFFPFSFVLLTIGPDLYSMTIFIIIFKIAYELGSISIYKLSISTFHSVLEATFKYIFIRKSLLP